jgi:hypothetical protein
VALKMKRIDSQVITHIEEAKNWLDVAREEYIQSNSIRGDLNLNLAHAEVKCAWELSHNQNVKHTNHLIQKQPTGSARCYLPAAAVSVLILSLLCVGLYLGTGMSKPNLTAKNDNIKPNRPAPVQIAAATIPEDQTVLDDSTTPIVKSKSVSNQPQNVSKVKINLPAAERNPKPSSSSRVKAVVESKAIPAKTASRDHNEKAVVEFKAIPANPEKPIATVSRNHNEKAVAQVSVVEPAIIPEAQSKPEKPRDTAQIQTKPVFVPLLIDEEALTKEASYSLRNGK